MYIAFFKQRGFTIIETIIVIAIFLIIIAGLLALYTNYNKVYNSQQATARVIGSSSITVAELQGDVRQASEIMTSYVFSGTTYTTDADTLVLKLPALLNSSSGLGEYDYIVYYLNGTKLYRQVLASANSTRKSVTQQLSDTISSVAFTYAIGSVGVDIQLQLTVGRSTVSHRIQQTLYLRNI